MAQGKKKTSPGRTTTAAKSASIAVDEQTIEDAVVVEERTASRQPELSVQPTDAAKSRFLPMVLGGLAAGAIGFGAAFFLKPTPAPVVVDNAATEQLAVTMAAENAELAAEIAALITQLAALKQSVADTATRETVAEMRVRLEQSGGLIASQSAALGLLENRISEIERRPGPVVGGTSDVAEEYQNQLTVMRQQITDELGRLASAISAVEAAQNDAVVRAEINSTSLALVAISRAVDSGDTFAAELAELTETGVDVPEVLQQTASDGVVTLADLQAQFPNAARAALSATTKTQADAGNAGKLGAFLKAQLGVRSLEPRKGDDADAVLSRAEAALSIGEIADAIAEINTLPTDGVASMADWVALAELRQTVVDALAELSVATRN